MSSAGWPPESVGAETSTCPQLVCLFFSFPFHTSGGVFEHMDVLESVPLSMPCVSCSFLLWLCSTIISLNQSPVNGHFIYFQSVAVTDCCSRYQIQAHSVVPLSFKIKIG